MHQAMRVCFMQPLQASGLYNNNWRSKNKYSAHNSGLLGNHSKGTPIIGNNEQQNSDHDTFVTTSTPKACHVTRVAAKFASNAPTACLTDAAESDCHYQSSSCTLIALQWDVLVNPKG